MFITAFMCLLNECNLAVFASGPEVKSLQNYFISRTAAKISIYYNKEQLEDDHGFRGIIIFNEKASFWMNGFINEDNCCI